MPYRHPSRLKRQITSIWPSFSLYLGKTFFCADVLYGSDNFLPRHFCEFILLHLLPCPFGKVVPFHLFGRSGKLLLQGFITEYLSELAGLERCTYLLPVIVQNSVYNVVVLLSFHTPPNFINSDVMQV